MHGIARTSGRARDTVGNEDCFGFPASDGFLWQPHLVFVFKRYFQPFLGMFYAKNDQISRPLLGMSLYLYTIQEIPR